MCSVPYKNKYVNLNQKVYFELLMCWSLRI